MKERASFTFDKETVEIIDKLIDKKNYRNKSHVVESALKLLAETELGGEDDSK
jgi:Arc/MetJ-type ribon-helix-helix transcriptional regulator